MNKLILVIGLALAYKAYQAFKTLDEETDEIKEVKEKEEVLTKKEVGEKILEAVQNMKEEKEKQKLEIQGRLTILQKELGILHDLEIKNEQLSTLGGIVVADISYNGLPIKEARKVREEELNYLFKVLKELEQNKEKF